VASSVFPSARTALLLIDVINLFDFPGGDAFARRWVPAARRIARLRGRAHRSGVPVVYVNDNFGRWQSDWRKVVERCLDRRSPGHRVVARLRPAPDDYFGFAVSVEGEAAVVGAPRHDISAPDGGSAYVFVRSGATWTEQRKLSAPDASAGDSFGRAVSISWDTVVAGAPADDTPGGADAGSVHVVHAAVPVELESFTVE